MPEAGTRRVPLSYRSGILLLLLLMLLLLFLLLLLTCGLAVFDSNNGLYCDLLKQFKQGHVIGKDEEPPSGAKIVT